MVSDARIRASDADRDRTAAALREHLAAGRLTAEEFDERLDKAYAAKTLGELDDLMTDLPGTDLEPPPDVSLHRLAGSLPTPGRSGGSIEARQGRFSPAWRAAWGSWLAVSVLVFAIWLVSGASGGLWFLWVVLPLGALLLGRWIMGAPARSERRPALPRRNHRHRDSGQARSFNRGAGCPMNWVKIGRRP
jgi:hypothetical protein